MDTLTVTDREQFLAMVASAPPMTADAIVCLCGEDAGPRISMAGHAFLERGAPRIILTGGKHDGKRWFGAKQLASTVYGLGVAHDRVTIDADSQNTHEQATAVVNMALVNDWRRLLIVASPYHVPRAILTFVKAIGDAEIRVVPMASNQSPWSTSPAGMTETRLELLSTELAKCEEYHEHVATFREGLDYLTSWEGR